MAATLQRPLRGSRISSFYPVKTLPSLASLDSAFQLQEYISLLIRLDPHDVDAIVNIPPTSPDALVDVDEACWIYEQLRRLAQDLSHPLITVLQTECTRQTCPEMKAGEWLYLCVAHGNDNTMEQCCAIDYIIHTLDSATALLNSPRAFPSRLSIPQTSYRHFASLARRLGRVFAHAYFHHRDAFAQAEAESSLYARFVALTARFDLVPAEFLVIPHETDADREPALPPAAQAHPQEHAPAEESGAARMERTGSLGRAGRSRTDTMVFSEGYSPFAQEESKEEKEEEKEKEMGGEEKEGEEGGEVEVGEPVSAFEVDEKEEVEVEETKEEAKEEVEEEGEVGEEVEEREEDAIVGVEGTGAEADSAAPAGGELGGEDPFGDGAEVLEKAREAEEIKQEEEAKEEAEAQEEEEAKEEHVAEEGGAKEEGDEEEEEEEEEEEDAEGEETETEKEVKKDEELVAVAAEAGV